MGNRDSAQQPHIVIVCLIVFGAWCGGSTVSALPTWVVEQYGIWQQASFYSFGLFFFGLVRVVGDIVARHEPLAPRYVSRLRLWLCVVIVDTAIGAGVSSLPASGAASNTFSGLAVPAAFSMLCVAALLAFCAPSIRRLSWLALTTAVAWPVLFVIHVERGSNFAYEGIWLTCAALASLAAFVLAVGALCLAKQPGAELPPRAVASMRDP